MLHFYITKLIETLAEAIERSPNTVARYVAGNGDFYTRLKHGHDLTTRRATQVIQNISDLWPSDTPWPADIPRPAPSDEEAA